MIQYGVQFPGGPIIPYSSKESAESQLSRCNWPTVKGAVLWTREVQVGEWGRA